MTPNTPNTLAKLAADLEQLASEGPELIHTQSGAYISQKLSEAAKALAAQATTGGGVTTGAPSEPFGYFKAEPFGWTDCAEDDDGAVALHERPQQAAQATAGWPASLTTAALKQSGATMESAAAHLESLPKMHQGKLLAHDLRRAASCCETAIESIQQATQPQAARTTEGI